MIRDLKSPEIKDFQTGKWLSDSGDRLSGLILLVGGNVSVTVDVALMVKMRSGCRGELVAKIKVGRSVVVDCKLDVWRWYRVVENKVGENIYHLRLAYRETQMELAYAIGLNSPNSISNYEKGYSHPKRDIL